MQSLHFTIVRMPNLEYVGTVRMDAIDIRRHIPFIAY